MLSLLRQCGPFKLHRLTTAMLRRFGRVARQLDSARLSVQQSSSAAAGGPGSVSAACILERLPLVEPTPPTWETDYQA